MRPSDTMKAALRELGRLAEEPLIPAAKLVAIQHDPVGPDARGAAGGLADILVTTRDSRHALDEDVLVLHVALQ